MSQRSYRVDLKTLGNFEPIFKIAQLIVQLAGVIAIIYGAHILDRQLGRRELRARETEITSRIIQMLTTDHNADPFATVPLLTTFGSNAVPSLIALMEGQSQTILDHLASLHDLELGHRDELPFWPLPEWLLNDECKGDPRFHEEQAVASSNVVRQAWDIWRASSRALRSIGTPAVDGLASQLAAERSDVRQFFLLRALLELHPRVDGHLSDSLGQIVLAKSANPRVRGLAIALLAQASGQPAHERIHSIIHVPNQTSIDLTCLSLPAVTFVGVGDRVTPEGALHLEHAKLGPGTRFVDFHHSIVHLDRTDLEGVSFRRTHLRTPAQFRAFRPITKVVFRNAQFGSESTLEGFVLKNPDFDNSVIAGTFLDVSIEEGSFENTEFGTPDGLPMRLAGHSRLTKSVLKPTSFLGYRGIAVDETVVVQGNSFLSSDRSEVSSPSWLLTVCENDQNECSNLNLSTGQVPRSP